MGKSEDRALAKRVKNYLSKQGFNVLWADGKGGTLVVHEDEENSDKIKVKLIKAIEKLKKDRDESST